MRQLVVVVVIVVLILIIAMIFLSQHGLILERTSRPTAKSTNTRTRPINSVIKEINIPVESANLPVVTRITSHALNVTLLNKSTVGLLSPSGLLLGTGDPINFPENSTDIFFSIKSTAKYHGPRLSLLLVTWLQTVDPSQVHIVTDSSDDPWIQAIQNRGITITVAGKCDPRHSRSGLCCKSGEEYKAYYMARKSAQHNYRWFCHVDDDAYVNMAQLVRMLKPYDPSTQKRYFGHYPESIWTKRRIFQKRNHELKVKGLTNFPTWKYNTFKYAHGSIYCISSSLMNELETYLYGKNFMTTCKKLYTNDDLAVGIIIEALLGYDLTEVTAMKSHIQNLRLINPKTLTKMVTIGYLISKKNRVTVPNSLFTEEEDPTSFLSYHCLLYPTTSWCLTKTVS